MNDVGLLEHRQSRDVGAAVGEIYLEEVLPFHVQAEENRQSLVEKVPSLSQSAVPSALAARVAEADDVDVLVGLLHDEHLSPYPAIVEAGKETARSNSCSAGFLVGVDDENFHFFWRSHKLDSTKLVQVERRAK